jgi:hypothetical protein
MRGGPGNRGKSKKAQDGPRKPSPVDWPMVERFAQVLTD